MRGATVVREARREERDPDKEIKARVPELSAVPRSHPEQEPDVKSNTKAPQLVCCGLLCKSSKFIVISFRPSASKEIEPKQAPLRSAPSQVLELPGGAPGPCACAGHSPAPRSEVRGQNHRHRPNNCEHQPIEEVEWDPEDANRPITGECSHSRALSLEYQSPHSSSQPFFSACSVRLSP